MDYELFDILLQCIDGVKASVEVRSNFISLLLLREKEIMVVWDNLYNDEMLDHLNIPKNVRSGMYWTELVAYLKANTPSPDPATMVSYYH